MHAPPAETTEAHVDILEVERFIIIIMQDAPQKPELHVHNQMPKIEISSEIGSVSSRKVSKSKFEYNIKNGGKSHAHSDELNALGSKGHVHKRDRGEPAPKRRRIPTTLCAIIPPLPVRIQGNKSR